MPEQGQHDRQGPLTTYVHPQNCHTDQQGIKHKMQRIAEIAAGMKAGTLSMGPSYASPAGNLGATGCRNMQQSGGVKQTNVVLVRDVINQPIIRDCVVYYI
jgi:hypothetical protein